MSQLFERADFLGQLRYLEDVVSVGDISTVEDYFQPARPAGRRFLDGLQRALRNGDREAGERAVRVLQAILTRQPRRLGRPARPSKVDRPVVRATRAKYLALVRRVWTDPERAATLARVKLATVDRTALRRLFQRSHTRPSDVANFLTAAELQLPVRHVRAALTRRPDLAYA
jgi:hypothetical protein